MATGTHTFAISVPVGAYHPFLRDALASLAAQEGPLQVALLDASGDARVRAIADEFNALFAYRRHGADKGQSDAIIEGWRETDGAILGWLNADDSLFPGALAAARGAFNADRELGVVYGHSTILDEERRTLGYHWSVEPPGPRILESGAISQPSCFFRRDGYERVGGLNRDLHYVMDWDLWIRLYKAGSKFGFLDKALSRVLWGEGTKTASFHHERRAELRRIIQTHAPREMRGKIMRSFAIHNLIDRLPRVVKTRLTRALIRGRNRINGVGGDGRMLSGASLPLVHYEDAPKSRLLVKADGADAVAAIAADGDALSLERRPGGVLVAALPRPLEKGRTLTVSMPLAEGGRAWLVHAALTQ